MDITSTLVAEDYAPRPMRCCACLTSALERWHSGLSADRLERHQKAMEWSTIGDTDSDSAGFSLQAASDTGCDLSDWEDVRDSGADDERAIEISEIAPEPMSKA